MGIENHIIPYVHLNGEVKIATIIMSRSLMTISMKLPKTFRGAYSSKEKHYPLKERVHHYGGIVYMKWARLPFT